MKTQAIFNLGCTKFNTSFFRLFSTKSIEIGNSTIKTISFPYKQDECYLENKLKEILLYYYNLDNSYDTEVTFVFENYNGNLTLQIKTDYITKFVISDIDLYINGLVDKINKVIYEWFYQEDERVIRVNIKGNILLYIDIKKNNNFNKISKHTTGNIPSGKRYFSSTSFLSNKYNKNKSLFNTFINKCFYSTYELNHKPINIIPVINTRTKVKSSKIWIDFNTIYNQEYEKFANELFYSGKIIPNTDYSLIVKIKKDDIFFTVGKKQEHFIFNSLKDEVFIKLFNKYTDLINDLLDEYDSVLHYSCDSILFEFRPVKIQEKLTISNLTEVKKEYPNLDTKTLAKDLDFFGNSLSHVNGSPIDYKIRDILEEDSSTTRKLEIINLSDVDNIDNFLSEFNSKISLNESSDYFITNKIEGLTLPTKLFLTYRLNKVYIISVNTFDKTVIKRCFNIYGDLISKVEDIDNNNGTFTRKHRNSTTIYKDNSIIFSSRDIKLSPVKNIYEEGVNSKLKTKDWLPNSNIATLDLETYEDEGVAKCYAIGFYSNEFKECKTYYIEEDLDSTNLIHKCLTEMFKTKYNKNIFYVHNLGRFDAPFIIKALIEYNKTTEGVNNPYIWNESTRNSDILKLTIKRRINNRLVSVTIQDSAAILPSSLRALCKDYQVETKKGFFPYNFCTKNTLFFVGKTPNITYYKDITEEDYMELYKDIWSLKDECLLYLDKDLISLCEVLVKVNKILHMKYKVQMTESLTISGLALKIFLKNHYDQANKPIPLVTNRIVWEDIYKAYYGGRVEVYNPKFKPYKKQARVSTSNRGNDVLYYYDVNSLYPFASLNKMPGLVCKYVEKYSKDPVNNDILDLNISSSLLGFFYCKIKSSYNYIGLLPKRSEEGRLTFPNGEWYGWHCTPELKLAQERGYKIEPVKGYIFNSVEDVFKSFVVKITEMKVNASNPSERNVAKLILNSLIGRLGMDFLKNITKILDGDKHDLYSVTRVLKGSIELDENLFLDTYKPGIDKEVCTNFGVDHIKALNMESNDEKSTIKSHNAVSIPVAATTLSYARVHMSRLIMYILDNKGKIYYTDTDSIVTNLKLPQEFIHESELGKLKLEHEIVEGYFISDKTYAFINTKGQLIKKAKGVEQKYLSFDDYKKMFKLKPLKNATKTVSKRDYSLGSVTIKTKDDIRLNVDNYTKRKRLFSNGKWVGTEPLSIKDIEEEASPTKKDESNLFTPKPLPSENKISGEGGSSYSFTPKNNLSSNLFPIDNKVSGYKIGNYYYPVIGNISKLNELYTNYINFKNNSLCKNFICKAQALDVYINLIVFILFMIISIIILEYTNELFDFKVQALLKIKNYSINSINSTLSNIEFINVYLNNPNLRPIHLSLHDYNIIFNKNKVPTIDVNYLIYNEYKVQAFNKNNYLNIYKELQILRDSILNSSTFNVQALEYLNKEGLRTPVYKKQYLCHIINDLWHNIISYSILNEGTNSSFKSIDSIKDYSLEYLLDKCNSNKIKISTLDFINIMNNITSYFAEGNTTDWNKLKLINNLTTHTFSASPESYNDVYQDTSTTLINHYQTKGNILTNINNNISLNTSTNNILTQNNNNLLIPGLHSTPIQGGTDLDLGSPLLEVSPLITDNKPDFNNLTNSDILKWRNEIWKSRYRS